MIDFSKGCIYCNATENLDTSMDVKLLDVKYRVSVCKTHEDTADLGKIKELVGKKLDDFKKLQEIAAQLGYDLKPNMPPVGVNNGLVIPTALPQVVPQAQQVAPQPGAVPQPSVPVNTATLPQVEVGQNGATMAIQRNSRSVAGPQNLEAMTEEKRRLDQLAAVEAKSQRNYAVPSSGDAPRYSAHVIPEQVQLKDGRVVEKPKTFQTVKEVVRGRAGTPTAISTKVDGSAGKTVINIKSTDERALEKKWKYEAEMSKGMMGNFAGSHQGSAIPREGYFESAECLMCSGTGRAKIGNNSCARCDGTGYRIQ